MNADMRLPEGRRRAYSEPNGRKLAGGGDRSGCRNLRKTAMEVGDLLEKEKLERRGKTRMQSEERERERERKRGKARM